MHKAAGTRRRTRWRTAAQPNNSSSLPVMSCICNNVNKRFKIRIFYIIKQGIILNLYSCKVFQYCHCLFLLLTSFKLMKYIQRSKTWLKQNKCYIIYNLIREGLDSGLRVTSEKSGDFPFILHVPIVQILNYWGFKPGGNIEL